MLKVLICASTASHINNFHLPYIDYFRKRGIEVHVAVPDPDNIKKADFVHEIPMAKSFFSPKNLAAARILRNVMRENKFDLVFTHASLAGAIGRVSLLLAGKGKTKVICTVHGYLFWNGCGFIKRMIYYLPEWLLKGITDCIITMNGEDYVTARKLVKKGGLVARVSGMGVDSSRFFKPSEEEKMSARKELSIPTDAFVMVYAAEFSKRKNHAELLKAMSDVVKKAPNALLLLCGTGILQNEIKSEAESLGLKENVRFLGWCGRMEKIYAASDLSVSTSRSEGLPFNIVESQMCALPVVASKIRGHTDLIENGINGLLYPIGDPAALSNAVIKVYSDPGLNRRLGEAAAKSAMNFSLEAAFKDNVEIYEKMMESPT